MSYDYSLYAAGSSGQTNVWFLGWKSWILWEPSKKFSQEIGIVSLDPFNFDDQTSYLSYALNREEWNSPL